MMLETTVLRAEHDVLRVEIDGDKFLLSIPSYQLWNKILTAETQRLTRIDRSLPSPFLVYDFGKGDFIYRDTSGRRISNPRTHCHYRPMLVPMCRDQNEVDEGFGREYPDGAVLHGGYLRFAASRPGCKAYCYGYRKDGMGYIISSIDPETVSFIPCLGEGDELIEASMEPLKWIVYDGVLLCENILLSTQFGQLRDTKLLPPSYAYKQRKGKKTK